MDFDEQISAVLHHKRPDRVPYMCFEDLLPRGDLELGLRQRGMGLCLRRPVVWCEYPHVDAEVKAEGDIATITYHTPKGDVYTRQRTHVGRLRDEVSCQLDGPIKGPGDYDPIVYMIDDAVFHVDAGLYTATAFEIGRDGIVRDDGPSSPYDATSRYYGYAWGVINPHQGLVNWLYHQEHHEDRFARLLAALEKQEERRLAAVLDSPVEYVCLGSLDGHYGPERWHAHVLPFLQRIVPRLRAEGKVCALHAHAPNLAIFKDAIAATGVDVIEGFTPPPGGDLSLAEARAAWGPSTVIWVNIPDTVLWYGADRTRQYVRDLVRSDPHPEALVVGFTEAGTVGMFDAESERACRTGYHAVEDALESAGAIGQAAGMTS